MQFCLQRFEVGIWSSAQKSLKNVDGVLGCLMGRLREKLLFVWDRYECTDSGFKSLENKRKPLFFKELGNLWKHFDGKYSESDTLFIDDQPYKALLNPPYTDIFGVI
ncbi:putative C-terminal domain small phosphatase [Prunus yedoensis var. nudiflora]|uniref:Putative C-terminal domain small phosphatase n=1 Tax=Prunus yedoensis var. nudiflora TaxID=2094558 RepID=A0A314Z8Q2_PRUYE|nr:putative C-terminal domain small phosphatase [Prunus yedoensis var. nudiflora]